MDLYGDYLIVTLRHSVLNDLKLFLGLFLGFSGDVLLLNLTQEELVCYLAG